MAVAPVGSIDHCGENLLTKSEVERLFGCSRSSINTLVRQGKLEVRRVPGHKGPLVTLRSVVDLMSQHKLQSGASVQSLLGAVHSLDLRIRALEYKMSRRKGSTPMSPTGDIPTNELKHLLPEFFS